MIAVTVAVAFLAVDPLRQEATSIMPMTVRRYQEHDRDQVAQVWRLSWNSTGENLEELPPRSDYAKRLAEEGLHWDIHVASIDDNVCGFVAFERQKHWLRQLFVLPSQQRGGIGRLLLEVAKREMPDGFWLRTDVENTVAQTFYERNGLLVRGRTIHPIRGHSVIEYVWHAAG